MPYDLYGTFYASERDAINAEHAQMAEIDAAIALRQLHQLRESFDPQAFAYWQEQVEGRLARLESFLPLSLCEGEGK